MPQGLSTQVLGAFKTGMDRSTRRGGKDGAKRLWTLQNAYLNERGDAVPRPGLQHVANVAHSTGLYGWQGQLHVFHGEDDYVDPGNPLVTDHLLRYPLAPPILKISGSLPGGFVGDTANFTYTVSGNVGACPLAITSGALPAGLSMDSSGHVTGTYTTAASASWTVGGTDADGKSATHDDSTTVTAATTWDAAKTSTRLTLSNGNLTATNTYASSSGDTSVGATVGREAATANHYFEVTFDLITSNRASDFIGIAATGSAVFSGTYGPGATGDSRGYRANGGYKTVSDSSSAYGPEYFTGDTIGCLLKNGKLYFRKNGTWIGDPVAETGYAFSGLTGTYFPAASSTYTTDQFTGRFRASQLLYALPAGATAWAGG